MIAIRRIISGPTGAGKTEKLLTIYHNLVKESGSNDKLVLLNNAQAVRSFRESIKLERAANFNIFSYFGFLQQEIRTYWDLVANKLESGRKRLQPIFMTVEPAHYIMSQMIKKEQEKGYFSNVKSTSQQLAVQLIDNLNHAALNNLSLKEAGERLLTLADEPEKQESYLRAIKVMEAFHNFCLQNRCIDYSLLVKLYNDYLLVEDAYKAELKKRYRHLLVDDLQLSSLSAQNLILELEGLVTESVLSFNPEEKRGSFFGAAPEAVKANFMKQAELIELNESKTASREAAQFGQAIADKIIKGTKLEKQEFVKEVIRSEFRAEMIDKAVDKAVSLIKQGVKAEEIAFITPVLDRVLEFGLEQALFDYKVDSISLTKNRLLLDNIFARALIVLTLLVKTEWEIELSRYSILKTLTLVLDLDPIRASLLATEIKKDDKLELPDLDQSNLRHKLGFKVGEEYDAFRSWILTKREQDPKLAPLFKELFGTFLTTLSHQQEDILACRQLIDSFDKFKTVMSEFKADFSEQDLGNRFINMITERTLAADILISKADLKEKILLTTPYTFLNSPHISYVKYLFLLDASSQLWFMGANKELSNPYILTEKESKWDDDLEQQTRDAQLADYLKNICFKSRDGIYLFKSNLNSKGWEQEGQMADWLEGY